MNSPPIVPKPSLNYATTPQMDATATSTWADRMATLAARYSDTQTCINKLDDLLASGKYTANEMRRIEEDSVRCFGLFVTALVRSYIGDDHA